MEIHFFTLIIILNPKLEYVPYSDIWTNCAFGNFNLDKLKHGAMCFQTLKLNAELTWETIPPRFNQITCKISFRSQPILICDLYKHNFYFFVSFFFQHCFISQPHRVCSIFPIIWLPGLFSGGANLGISDQSFSPGTSRHQISPGRDLLVTQPSPQAQNVQESHLSGKSSKSN